MEGRVQLEQRVAGALENGAAEGKGHVGKAVGATYLSGRKS